MDYYLNRKEVSTMKYDDEGGDMGSGGDTGGDMGSGGEGGDTGGDMGSGGEGGGM